MLIHVLGAGVGSQWTGRSLVNKSGLYTGEVANRTSVSK